MANKEEKADEKQSSWKDNIYNPRTGEFIGRTASSWVGWVFLDVMHELAFGPSSPSSSLSSQGQTGSPQAPVPIGLLKEINLIQMKTISSREDDDVLYRSLFVVRRAVLRCFNGAWDCFTK
ncbi:Sodium/potassium-transporting ATPase subunit beta-3 [Anabarilius grahami]|uniref:Sodium/potassium-transporting ATPase subunit beta-3 n=1 Tax=Anabarilius grahami TaxID=495550 RepID=A0A3N0XFJ7_ANAGA|nr:Sodium/potassium-transporting ATPase subunit beta-3 [Anabarilius grahami]